MRRSEQAGPTVAGGFSARGRNTLFSKLAQAWLLKDDGFRRFRHEAAAVCNGRVCAPALLRCIPPCSEQRLGRGFSAAPLIAVQIYKHHLSEPGQTKCAEWGLAFRGFKLNGIVPFLARARPEYVAL